MWRAAARSRISQSRAASGDSGMSPPASGAGPMAPVSASRDRNCTISPGADRLDEHDGVRRRRHRTRRRRRWRGRAACADRPRRPRSPAPAGRCAPASGPDRGRRWRCGRSASGGLPSRPTSRNRVATQWARSRSSLLPALGLQRVPGGAGDEDGRDGGQRRPRRRRGSSGPCRPAGGAAAAVRFAGPWAGAIANISRARLTGQSLGAA